MKKRLLAGMLGASLAISSTPAQAGFITDRICWLLFKLGAKGKIAEQVEKSNISGKTWREKIGPEDKIFGFFALAAGLYFFTDFVSRKSTEDNLGMLSMLAGLARYNGCKASWFPEDSKKAKKSWERTFGTSYDHVSQSFEGMKKGAQGIKKGAKGLISDIGKVAKSAVTFFGAGEDEQAKPADSKQPADADANSDQSDSSKEDASKQDQPSGAGENPAPSEEQTDEQKKPKDADADKKKTNQSEDGWWNQFKNWLDS